MEDAFLKNQLRTLKESLWGIQKRNASDQSVEAFDKLVQVGSAKLLDRAGVPTYFSAERALFILGLDERSSNRPAEPIPKVQAQTPEQPKTQPKTPQKMSLFDL